MRSELRMATIGGGNSEGRAKCLFIIDGSPRNIKSGRRKVKIPGYKFVDIKDDKQPNGTDRVLIKQEGNITWARFYTIETNEPLFSGRDSAPKKTVAEIEHERRNGYAWYGEWPSKLLTEKYPEWKKKNSQ